MIVLISQLITTLLTTLISIIALNKDLRSRTQKLKKEARTIKYVLFFVAAVSGINSYISYYNSEADKLQGKKDKNTLTKNLNNLKTDNANIQLQNTDLRKALTASLLSQSKLITASQQKSADQLTDEANNLSKILNGSNKPPIFSFVGETEDHLIGMIRNTDSLPIYGFGYRVTNMKMLEQCPIKFEKNSKKFSVTADCFNKSNFEINTNIRELQIEKLVTTEIPGKENLGFGKYLVKIDIKSKSFYEEAIYKIINGKIFQTTKVLELQNTGIGIVKSWIVPKAPDINLLKDVDWKKEFPQDYVINLQISP